MTFEARSLTVHYGTIEALAVDSLSLSPGEFVALTGPNGAGKSTLLTTLAGMRGYGGSCLLDGREVRSWPRRSLARVVSFLPQQVDLQFPFTAGQVVLMGRTPHCGGLFDSAEDIEAAERAIALTDIAAFRDRDFRTLSGGERQRVLVASALAQSPRALLVDEPATFLDLRHQLALYRLLRELAAQGLLVMAATHDLNLAARYAHRVLVLDQARLAATSLSADVIRNVFGVEARIVSEDGGARIHYDL